MPTEGGLLDGSTNGTVNATGLIGNETLDNSTDTDTFEIIDQPLEALRTSLKLEGDFSSFDDEAQQQFEEILLYTL